MKQERGQRGRRAKLDGEKEDSQNSSNLKRVFVPRVGSAARFGERPDQSSAGYVRGNKGDLFYTL